MRLRSSLARPGDERSRDRSAARRCSKDREGAAVERLKPDRDGGITLTGEVVGRLGSGRLVATRGAGADTAEEGVTVALRPDDRTGPTRMGWFFWLTGLMMTMPCLDDPEYGATVTRR
ncbi:MAG: hypothetical protein V3S21_07440 [Xanthomonadales bacterium]